MAKIKNLKPFEYSRQATYLVLISPETIPHLVLVHHGRYYSLTHKKVILGEDFSAYLTFLKRAKRKIVFLELETLENHPLEKFEAYKRADRYVATCLNPIIDTVHSKSEAGFVYELVPELYNQKKIKNAFYLNMENDLTDLGDFNLSEYSKEAIFSYIESLNKKYAKRS